MNQIYHIGIGKLKPHPKNPRTDVGDVTELAESIKANGIFQNLTVVKSDNDTYTVVIGHRRLAAAQIAGLQELPCVISEMDEKTQVATMLSENIQRSSLTVIEEAKGFQMMFDLGASMKEITAKTGLSETTVRKRTKLLELDYEAVCGATARGATLQDFCDVNTLNDIKLRNKVLSDIGTPNFRASLEKAKTSEIIQKNKPEIIVQLERFAVKTNDASELAFVDSYYLLEPADIISIPADAGHLEYYYTENGHYIYLYKEKLKTLEEIKADKKAEDIRFRRNELEELQAVYYKCRIEFIRNCSEKKKVLSTVLNYMADLFCSDKGLIGYSEEMIASLLGIIKDDDYEYNLRRKYRDNPEFVMVCMIFSALEGEHLCYFDNDATYLSNVYLDKVYGFLCKLGYEMSDEEKLLQNGEHELFIKGA